MRRRSGKRADDSAGRDVRPDGEHIGEIVVRGNTVMLGYYRDPDATGTTIRDGWLHTGDMATLDEAGYVLIKDRAKDVIIRGGENISSVDVENALSAHPAVLECAVVAAPDERFGEVPIALVVLKPGATATARELKAHCRAHLARFKVPHEFLFRDALAKGGTGKILKSELREPFWRFSYPPSGSTRRPRGLAALDPVARPLVGTPRAPRQLASRAVGAAGQPCSMRGPPAARPRDQGQVAGRLFHDAKTSANWASSSAHPPEKGKPRDAGLQQPATA